MAGARGYGDLYHDGSSNIGISNKGRPRIDSPRPELRLPCRLGSPAVDDDKIRYAGDCLETMLHVDL
jgi:hypothetical protein